MEDSLFVRGQIPMTKSEVRAVSLSKLSLVKGAVFWDVGAGTGSVSIEAGRYLELAGGGTVYAVERNPEGIRLIEENRRHLLPDWKGFHLISGRAPEALQALPAPTHVFIGGSGGQLREILKLVLEKNGDARIVINSITAETLAECLELVKEFSFSSYEIVQVAVSRLEKAGRYHLQMGQNPVYVIRLEGAGQKENGREGAGQADDRRNKSGQAEREGEEKG